MTKLLAEEESDTSALGRAERLRPSRELLGIAVCGYSRDPDAGPEVGEVRALFVSSRRWRGGVGRELMEAALADLRERGFAQATLWTLAANERANGFYEAHGFRPDGTERTEEAWAHLPQLRYRRDLA